MVSRFVVKSLLGIVSIIPVAFALRSEIQDFIFLSPSSVSPLKLDFLGETVGSPRDHIDIWLSVIDDHQEPLQQSQIDSSGDEGSVGGRTVNRDLEPIESTSPELAEVLNASKSRRKIRNDSQRLLNELERLTPQSVVVAAPGLGYLPNDFVFLDVWTKQKGLIDAERELRAARLKNPDSVGQLRIQLESVLRASRYRNSCPRNSASSS